MNFSAISLFHRFLILILFGLISACDTKNVTKNQKSKTINVHIVTVERQGLAEQQLVTGTLEALSTVRIYNQEPGRIKQLPYYQGDTVNKDQLIAVLDDTLLTREFEKASAQHRQAKLTLKRLQQLISRKLASDDQLARAETLVEQARADENLFLTRLSYSKIHAPMAGVITERLHESGDVVALHSHILSIADISSLKITLSLSELISSQLKEDMTVSVRIDALGDQKFSGKILRIHPTINNVSRQGTIEIIFDKVPPDALPGQLCRVEINTVTAPRLIIPLNTIRNDTLGEYVFRVNEEQIVEKVRINTGIQINDLVEILSGLSLDDHVVIKGFQGLTRGSKVKIIPGKAGINPAPETRPAKK